LIDASIIGQSSKPGWLGDDRVAKFRLWSSSLGTNTTTLQPIARIAAKVGMSTAPNTVIGIIGTTAKAAIAKRMPTTAASGSVYHLPGGQPVVAFTKSSKSVIGTPR
jgi:hypothetical protein